MKKFIIYVVLAIAATLLGLVIRFAGILQATTRGVPFHIPLGGSFVCGATPSFFNIVTAFVLSGLRARDLRSS